MAAEAPALVRRLSKLKSLRQPHEFVWRDCFDHSFPIRGSGLQSNTLTAQSALDRKARLVDSTATDAGRILASSLQAGMTPANARWFNLDVYGADDGAKTWLDNAADQLHQEIHNANFDSEALDSMLDVVAAGWFCMHVDVDHDHGGLVFDSWPIAQCYFASTRADGVIDTVFRTYTLTAAQAVSFAEARGGTVSGVVQAKAITEPDHTVEMVHCIFPRTPHAAGARMSKNMPIASVHLELQQQSIVLESGYEEMPVICPRWSLIPDSAYAVGPMFDALPDCRMLNELKRMDLASADIAIGGMWIAEDDGVLNPRTIKVGARKVIVANSVDSMKALTTGANFQLADERIAQLQGCIRKLLMADQLQPQDGPAMTATEIHARIALIRQQLGPTFGRMQAEYLQGLVVRCFMLAMRAGIFGQPPQSIAGRGFAVKYISPLARAQKLEDVTAIQQTLGYVLQVAPVRPDILDNYDFDEIARTLAEGQGVPMKIIVDLQQVQALRQQRAQQQAQAQQQAHQQEIQTMAAGEQFKAAGARAAAA
jgi:hypothetical protein